MKKLMFGAAALAACASYGVVESANVVGYLETDVSGTSLITPAFADLSAETYPISSIVVNGATDDMNIRVKRMNSDGSVSTTYFWYLELDYGDLHYDAGWYLDGGEELADIELTPGEACFFTTSVQGLSLTSSGNVPGEISRSVVQTLLLGNGSPVELDVDSMIVENASDMSVSMQTLDSTGVASEKYYWYNVYDDGTLHYDAGWYLEGGEEPAGIALAPGEGVFVKGPSSDTGITMTIPSALQ